MTGWQVFCNAGRCNRLDEAGVFPAKFSRQETTAEILPSVQNDSRLLYTLSAMGARSYCGFGLKQKGSLTAP